MQVKDTMRYHHTIGSMAKIKKNDGALSWIFSLYVDGASEKRYDHFGKLFGNAY